jgi:hypothetical protein
MNIVTANLREQRQGDAPAALWPPLLFEKRAGNDVNNKDGSKFIYKPAQR